MERVSGIGGYFLRATDPAARGAWYRECLGLDAMLAQLRAKGAAAADNAPMRPWVRFSTALAPVFLIGGWTLAQTRQPQSYDPLRDTISALAAHGAADAWIMTAGLAGLGACHLITAAGFRVVGPAARVVLAIGGAATVVVAASPQPAAAHVPAATVGFVALALWPALVRRKAVAGRWLSIVLCSLLAWFAIALALASAVGLSERVLAGAEALTPLALVLSAASLLPGSRR